MVVIASKDRGAMYNRLNKIFVDISWISCREHGVVKSSKAYAGVGLIKEPLLLLAILPSSTAFPRSYRHPITTTPRRNFSSVEIEGPPPTTSLQRPLFYRDYEDRRALRRFHGIGEHL